MNKIKMFKLAICCIFAGLCRSSFADITLTNAKVTDVTTSSFSVIWHASTVSEPRIEVFSDAEGLHEITSNFEVSKFPLQGQGADLDGKYEQAEAQRAYIQNIQSQGLMKVQVSGLAPNQAYFFKVHSENGTESGVWPSAKTERVNTQTVNTFQSDARQLVVKVKDLNSSGWPVIVSAPNALYPISAFVQDGAEAGSAVVNLANLFRDGVNLKSTAVETLTIDVLKSNGELSSDTFDMPFNKTFSVASLHEFKHKNIPFNGLLQFVSPNNDIYSTGDDLTLSWKDDVPNVNAVISLYIANNKEGHNGIKIADGIKEDADGLADTFLWHTANVNDGRYYVYAMASDGSNSLTAYAAGRITIDRTSFDSDADGLSDLWELHHFDNLDNDGNGDFDGDGRSNLQEFLTKTDPKVINGAPVSPQILSPIFDADTLTGAKGNLQPILTVTNGKHPADVGAVSIVFEVYSDEGLTHLIAAATLDETANTTSLIVTPVQLLDGASFNDNQVYFWRAKSQQKAGANNSSAWVKSQFFINTANDAPSLPHISSPANNSLVADFSPLLSITNATDIDRDTLSYSFSLYDESNLTTAIASVSDLTAGLDGQTEWRLPKLLKEDNRYQWQVKVSDGHGAEVASEWASFLVSSENNAPSQPQIDSPVNGATVKRAAGDSNLTLSVINAIDPEHAVLTYYIELDKVNTFDSAEKRTSSALNAGANGKTTWVIKDLPAAQNYYWRTRAFDGQVYSEWQIGQFSLIKINEAPSVPTLHNPVNNALLSSLQPALEVNSAVDPEGKPVTYRFQLYADEKMATLIAENLTVTPLWQLDFNLADKTVYYWRVRAEDAEQLPSAWTDLISFTIKLPVVNAKPSLAFVLPSANTTADSNGVLIQWTDSDADSDAKIDLFVTDANGIKTTIAQQLDENSDGVADQFLWDTRSIAAGVYKIGATISDELNVASINHCCHVTIAQPSASPPLSQWLFNENTGIQTFSSVGSASALLKEKSFTTTAGVLPTWVAARNAQSGAALQFNGASSYVELPKASSAPLLTNSSLSFWLNTTQIGGISPSFSPVIVGNDLKNTGNDIQWGSIGSQGGIGLGVGGARILSLAKVNDGKWHHVVITRDVKQGSSNGLVKIYVDALLSAMGSPNDPQFTGLQNDLVGLGVNAVMDKTSPLQLGSKFYEGSLDDVRIFDRVLNRTEVAAIFTTEGGSLPSDPLSNSQIETNGIYQAENATIFAGQVMVNNKGYTGSGFVDYDYTVLGYVEWTVDRSVTGPVTLKFRYSNGDGRDRPMSISVNGVVVNSALSFPFSNNWNTWGIASVVVNLNQGINTIRAVATKTVGGPNVDYLQVQ